MVLLIIFFGICLGSFVNATVWRVYQQSLPKKKRAAADDRLSVLKGRSMCPHCKHELAWYDLIPLVSWLLLRGKCRYCQKAISRQYPLVELLGGLLFGLSYVFWPYALRSLSDYFIFGLWLAILTGLLVLLIYDLKWMILPTRVIYLLWPLVISFRLAISLQYDHLLSGVVAATFGALALGGFFYLLFAISDKWIGGGDIRLGFLLGALVGSPMLALLLLFVASFAGCILALPQLALKRLQLQSKLAFGPLLIVAAIFVLLWGQPLIDLYTQRFFLL